jgi:phenylacetate-CoA ligase
MDKYIEEIELLSYQECYEKVDKYLLSKQLQHVIRNSPFYYDKFKGIDLNTIHTKDSLLDLAFTDKREILEEQEAHPPFGRLAIGTNERSLRRVHVTSGSTGRPVYIILSENDLAATVEAGRRAFMCAGLTPEDTVIHCLNYCLWAGGLTDHLNLEATGATVIPFGVGNTLNLIRSIRDLHPTAISCTPSYLSRLEYVLEKEFNMQPPELRLKKAFLGGESGVQDPNVRSKIETTWKIRAIDANYGMADVLSIFGSECEAREGLHFHGQGILHFELIEPETMKNLSLEDGQVGEMVLTNLKREVQPLVRYRTGDVVRIVSTKQCKCGRSSFRFVIIGRTDEMIVVRGINVFPSVIANILSERPDWFTGEFEFVLDNPPPIERPLLRIELKVANINEADNTIESFIQRKCREDYNFTPRIQLLTIGTLPRTEGKSKRLKRFYQKKEIQ